MASILDLPVEILHHICTLIGHSEVQTFRLTCHLFGEIGAEHVLPELNLAYKRDSFERAVAISQHGLISKGIRALFFEIDRLRKYADYTKWYQDHIEFSDMKEEIPVGRELDEWQSEHERPKCTHTEAQLSSAYARYLQLCEDQDRLHADGFDRESLTTIFRNCPQMHHITVNGDHGVRIQTRVAHRAFKDALVCPFTTVQGDQIGVHELTAILLAARDADITLRSLQAGDISHKFLVQDETITINIRAVMYQVHYLVLVLGQYLCISDDESENEQFGIDYDAERAVLEDLEGGALLRFTCSAPNLKVLSITRPLVGDLDSQISLKRIVGGFTWHCLTRIALERFTTTVEDLIAFLNRHKEKLEYIALAEVHISGDHTTETFFRAVGGKLPRLQKARIRGSWSCDDGRQFQFRSPLDPFIHSLTARVERYVVEGGKFPVETESDEDEDDDGDQDVTESDDWRAVELTGVPGLLEPLRLWL